MKRRDIILSAAALAALPLSASAAQRSRNPDSPGAAPPDDGPPKPEADAANDSGFRLTGSQAQGGLVIGDAGSGAEVWIDGQPVRVADGRFCFGFAHDATKPVAIRIRYGGRMEETHNVVPKKRNFPVQRINGLPEPYVSPPKELLEQIAIDAKAVAEARSHDSDETWFLEKFDWPANGPITGIYGSSRILNGQPREAHYGLDIAAKEGSPVLAPMPGIVMLADHLYLSGNTMIIDHGHGVSTSYLHMSRMDAKVGDRLKRKQPIGLVGQTGRATGPHLCWRLNWFQTRLDVGLVVSARPGDKA
jgi:hypothetical protein